MGVGELRSTGKPASNPANGEVSTSSPADLAQLVARQTEAATTELETLRHKLADAQALNHQLDSRVNELTSTLQSVRSRLELFVRNYAQAMAAVKTMRAATDELIAKEAETIDTV